MRGMVVAHPRAATVTTGPFPGAAWTLAVTYPLEMTAPREPASGPPSIDNHDVPWRALEALDAATRGIAGVLDVERVLQLIVDGVRELAKARYAALGIADAGGAMERFISSGVSAAERAAIGALPRGHGLLGLIIREGRSYRIPEIRAHPDSYGFPPHHPPMHSFLGVPVTLKGRSVGNLYLADKVGAAEFSPADQRLVEMFARHAGIAIENARLHARVQQLAVMEERERIGKDLHDGIIQGLYGVSLSLEDVPEIMDEDRDEAAARVDRAIDGLNAAIRDIRNFIVGLGPELAAAGGLGAGLAALADELELNTMIDVELDLPERTGLDGEGDEELHAQFLLIAREALSNVARHSRASRATIRLATADTGTELVVADNGRGFDPTADPGSGHLGLANIARRAAAIGAIVRIESAAAAGTRIIVSRPRMKSEIDES